MYSFLLYMPAVHAIAGVTAQDGSAQTPYTPAATVSAYDAYTTDAAFVEKTAFTVGETIRYFGVVHNPTASVRSIFVTWSLSGPCGNSTLRSGRLNAGPGFTQWFLLGTVPNCPGAFTYTFTVNDSGVTTSFSYDFTILGAGDVSMSSVDTLNATGTPTTTFRTGDTIRYLAFINNTTPAVQTVPVVYSLDGSV